MSLQTPIIIAKAPGTQDSSQPGEPRFQGIPRFLYGTAFKGDRNTSLVEKALRLGFVGIDTASNTKNYQEKLVGDGVRNILKEGVMTRDQIYISTKFSHFAPGKEPQYFPYDTTADIETQVHQSVQSSLKNLDTSNADNASLASSPYLDNLTMHAPYPTIKETLRVWRVLETYVPHQISTLGISNIDLSALSKLCNEARVKPALVQNRFTQDTEYTPLAPTPEDAYDAKVRRFCEEHRIVYQPWGSIWGTPKLLESEVVAAVGKEIGVKKEIALYLCIMSLGNVSMLCGTKQEERMKVALEGLRKFDEWHSVEGNPQIWDRFMEEVRSFIEA